MPVGTTTWKLTANCDTTAQLTVPAPITTVDGGGFTITATDPADFPTTFFQGGVVTNDLANHELNVENLHIQGTGFAFVPGCARGNLFGIWFNDASGSVTGVTIDGITEDSGCVPTTGIGIRADGVTAPRTVTITNTTVTNYQRNGIDARGFMTMNVSGSTVHPKDLSGVIGQNGVVYAARFGGQPDGSVSGSTIFGIGDVAQLPTPESALQPAIALVGAKNVTVTNNTLTSDASFPFGPDQGVLVADSNEDGTGTPSTGIVVSHNSISRASADGDDPNGIGVFVFPASDATLVCNTFSNWRVNVVGAIQIGCTPLPNGAECTPYSAPAPTVEGSRAPFSWSITAGSLPPGLTLGADGAITGTPTKRGTYTFTVQVTGANELTASQEESITIAPGCAVTTTTPVTEAGSTAAPPTSAVTTTATSSTGTLPFTGGLATVPIVGLALLAAGTVLTGSARRRHNRRNGAR